MSIINYDSYDADLETMKIINTKYADKFGEMSKIIVTYIFYSIKKIKQIDPDKYKDISVDNLLSEYHSKFFNEFYNDIYFHDIYKSFKNSKDPVINENKNLYNYFIDLYSLDDLKSILMNYLNHSFRKFNILFDEYKADDLATKMLNIEKNSKILYLYESGWRTIGDLLNYKDTELDIIINMKKVIGDSIEIIKMGLAQRDYLEGYIYLKVYTEINNLKVKILDSAKKLLKEENDIKYNRIYCEVRGQSQTEYYPIEDQLVRKCLDKNGIAIKLLLNYDLDHSANIYRHTREDDLNDNKLKAIIALPADIKNNMYASTTSNSIMIYDSYKEQNEVIFVNAIEECKESKDDMVLTEDNINNIINCVNGDKVDEKAKLSKVVVSYEEIKRKPKEILFSPFDYVEASLNGKPAIFLEDIAEIYRGSEAVRAQVQKQQEGDVKDENEDSVYRSITYADLTGGVKNYNTKVNGRYLDKYVLNNNDLLINKNGVTTNVFIFKQNEDKTIKVVPDSNLIAIKIKENGANAVFLQSYLKSKIGMKLITDISQSGAVLRSINIKKLGKVPIPKVSKSEQDRFAEEYDAKTKEIKSLEEEIKNLQEKYF